MADQPTEPQATFTRADLKTEAQTINSNVYRAIVESKDVKLLPEKWAEMVLSAHRVQSYLVQAQVLDQISADFAAGKLTEELIERSITHLCRRLDAEAQKLGEQLELIHEVANAPELRH